MSATDQSYKMLPSLLMQAARSAAVADGLVPSARKGSSPDPVRQAQSKSSFVNSKSSDDAKSATETAAAALAMVAAGNSSHMRPPSLKPNGAQHAMELARAAIMNSSHSQQQQQQQQPRMGEASTPVIKKVDMGAGPSSIASRLGVIAAPAPPLPTAPAPVPLPMKATKSKPPVIKNAPPAPQSASSSSKKKGPPLRRGKWTSEEEAYASRLIQEFKAGLLPLTDGTTLRTFLSKLLNCDPMRISKKFVGSNCIGKQVFRRRTADINRLTPEQIHQSRAELSELERRFLERVAQTNRVKSSGGVGGNATANANKVKEEEAIGEEAPPSPPWLRPPSGYKPGQVNVQTNAPRSLGQTASASTTMNSRAAAAGRALLQGSVSGGAKLPLSLERKLSKPSLTTSTSHSSAGLLAMAEMHRRHTLQSAAATLSANTSASNLLSAAVSGNAEKAAMASTGLSGTAMAQIARNASAARIAGLAASGNSMTNLMLKTGLSRDQLQQLARNQQLASSHSLSNLMKKQSSLDALMSLDFQSLQSIDNLANLIQSGGGAAAGVQGHAPRSGLKNWSMEGSNGNLNGLAGARRLASESRMESLIRSLSSSNVNSRNGLSNASLANAGAGGGSGGGSNFMSFLQNSQNPNSGNNFLGSGSQLSAANAMSLANMLRVDSSTGLTALRMQDGLVQRNSSVDDFLSLVASGDIPHQDPHLLNIPLQTMLQQQQQAAAAQNNSSGAQAAANFLAQQQLLAQAANKGNNSLSNSLLSRLSNNSAASLLSQYASSQNSAGVNAAAAAFAQQHQQARASQHLGLSALAAAQQHQQARAAHNLGLSALASARNSSSNLLKRKMMENDGQRPSKR